MPTMRKDLRVGLGIGGVLLAVLVVALIVRSHGKDKTKIAKIGGDTAVQTDPDSGEPTPPVDGAQGTSPDGTAVAPGDTPKKSDPFDPEGGTTPATLGHGSTGSSATPAAGAATGGSPDDWEKLLNASNPGPVHSVTPAAGQSSARPGRSSRGGDKPNLPPGLRATNRRDDEGSSSGAANGADLLKPAGNTTTGGGGGRTSSPASGGTPRTHVIQKGETFASISRTVYGDGKYYLQILRANPGLEPSALKPGTRINLPELASAGESRTSNRSSHSAGQAGANGVASIDHKTQYKVESGDSLYKIAEKLYGDANKVDAIYDANKQAIGPDPRKLKLGMILKLPEQPTVASAAR
jgi:nucleoid-associated protein YgaU